MRRRRRVVDAMIQEPLYRTSQSDWQRIRAPRWNLIEAVGNVPEMREGLEAMPRGFHRRGTSAQLQLTAGQQEGFDQVFVRVRRLERGIVLGQGSLPGISRFPRMGEVANRPILLCNPICSISGA